LPATGDDGSNNVLTLGLLLLGGGMLLISFAARRHGDGTS